MRLNESHLNRRDFLDGLIGAGFIACGVTGGEAVLGYLGGLEVPEPDRIVISPKSMKILERDRFVLVAYGPQPIIIFKLPDGHLRVLSAVCTHGQCNVRYRPDENDIYCGCHKGRYTADGVNVPGTPPPRPLRKYYLDKQDDGTLFVSNKPFDNSIYTDGQGDSSKVHKG